ncbi:MAG: hypothetical protein HQL38_20775 [Alphaproteobacteria bacterium]|nr:hypothetical protein [Alphaproteobacteria bacterium]
MDQTRCESSDWFNALVAAAFPDPDAALIAAAQAARESLVQTTPAEIRVHALVGRTMRFRDPADETLRRAAIASVTAEMPGVVDIRNHDALQDWVAHARVLSEDADDLETARLLGWVARHDSERGAYRAAEAGYRRERAGSPLRRGPSASARVSLSA